MDLPAFFKIDHALLGFSQENERLRMRMWIVPIPCSNTLLQGREMAGLLWRRADVLEKHPGSDEKNVTGDLVHVQGFQIRMRTTSLGSYTLVPWLFMLFTFVGSQLRLLGSTGSTEVFLLSMHRAGRPWRMPRLNRYVPWRKHKMVVVDFDVQKVSICAVFKMTWWLRKLIFDNGSGKTCNYYIRSMKYWLNCSVFLWL